MSIRKKSEGKWQVDIRLGRQARHRETFHGTQEEAFLYEQELKKQLGRDVQNHADKITDIVQPYLEWVSLHQSPKTYFDKKKMIFANLLPFFGNMYPDFIDNRLVNSYKMKRKKEIEDRYKALAADENRHPLKYQGDRTINLEILCLQAMIRWRTKEDVKFERLPYKRPIPSPLTREESLSFMDALKREPFYYALFLCLYNAGLRKNEVFTLTWDRVNFQAGLLRVIGKGNRERYVPMTFSLSQALSELPRASGLVFPSPRTGQPLTDIRRAIRRAKARAGITKRIYPHQLRHSIATQLLEEGNDIRMIQMFLGHEDIQTRQIYTRVAVPMLQKMMIAFEGGHEVVTTAIEKENQEAVIPSQLPDSTVKIGEPCRDRTCDPLIKSQLLYHLS
jgi:integrase/recombinase XerD